MDCDVNQINDCIINHEMYVVIFELQVVVDVVMHIISLYLYCSSNSTRFLFNCKAHGYDKIGLCDLSNQFPYCALAILGLSGG